jgi:hypothetical protein
LIAGLGLTGSNPDLIAIALIRLIDEDKTAEALFHLFNYHKQDLQLWVRVKAIVTKRATTHRRLSLTNSILNASTRNSLAESCVVVPGLSSFLATQMKPFNFNANATEDKKDKVEEAPQAKSITETDWTKFCQSNPSYPGCRFYEI